ncbi:MAG: tRNA pseudouridine(13) synthase TruD [Nitrospinae bacterium]|nr:tRNA pseudouridine(13) synthase TruD [Nitrospinota bacterium]
MEGTYLTDSVPGTGGRLRARPEDFRVEEIPLAPPGGDGEHLHLWVEKRGVPTIEALRALCGALGVRETEAGYAGLKDSNAVTRQWFSFQTKIREIPGAVLGLEKNGIRVLEAARSRTRVRRGALAGNRFEILVRDVGPDAEKRAQEILDCLAARGLPNAFGDQRFGVHGHTARVGFALVKGDWRGVLDALLGSGRFTFTRNDADERLLEAARRYEAGEFRGARELYPPSWEAERRALARLEQGASPRQAASSIPARERVLYGGAFQACLFNLCLARRLEAHAHAEIWMGDVIFHHETGMTRRAGAPEKEARALERFEVSPAGPLVGRKLVEARGEAGKLERSVLESLGVGGPGILNGLEGLKLYGSRRPYRVRMKEESLRPEKEGLRLFFTLPPGAYASEVLRELTKNEPPVGAVTRIGGER